MIQLYLFIYFPFVYGLSLKDGVNKLHNKTILNEVGNMENGKTFSVGFAL